MEIESDGHVSTILIAQELNVAQKAIWNLLKKAGFKKKFDVKAKKPLCPIFVLRSAPEWPSISEGLL